MTQKTFTFVTFLVIGFCTIGYAQQRETTSDSLAQIGEAAKKAHQHNNDNNYPTDSWRRTMLKLAILEKVVIALYVILIGTWLWMVYENRKIKREFSKDGKEELEQLERLAEFRRTRRISFQREAELDRRFEELAQRIRELEAEIAAFKKRQLDSRQSYSTT